jgi:hypothetical protein
MQCRAGTPHDAGDHSSARTTKDDDVARSEKWMTSPPRSTGKPGANQYASESAAKAHCR